jgi:CBS domain-containing protein
MKQRLVQEIVISRDEDVPLTPSVSPGDRITQAIEVMLKSDLKRITVTRRKKVVGMITLEDALKKVGLEGDVTSRGKRSIIFQGREITLEK